MTVAIVHELYAETWTMSIVAVDDALDGIDDEAVEPWTSWLSS